MTETAIHHFRVEIDSEIASCQKVADELGEKRQYVKAQELESRVSVLKWVKYQFERADGLYPEKVTGTK